ncbi:WhiB family transcriptional regulator [Streptomyces sp. NPDC046985]|uniref:WhiB family transcriptional regulator n=1 Tax=Streptomyces sp. NPDC046985 TaxID=3155377 RepID=UPI0033DFD7E2
MTSSSQPQRALSDWRDQAACVGEDPDIFFPLADSVAPGAETALARSICRRCPVLLACRTWAIERGEDEGIWGATTAAQRRAIRRAAAERGSPFPAPARIGPDARDRSREEGAARAAEARSTAAER